MTRPPDGDGSEDDPHESPPDGTGIPHPVVPSRTERWTEEVRASAKLAAPRREGRVRVPQRPAPRAAVLGPPRGPSKARSMDAWMGAEAPGVPTARQPSDEIAAVSPEPVAIAVKAPRRWPRVWIYAGGALVGIAILTVREQRHRHARVLDQPISVVAGTLPASPDTGTEERSAHAAVARPSARSVAARSVAARSVAERPVAEHHGLAAGPRDAPPGTSPEAAAALARLPISAADLPPVGEIGESGIHVDRIATGSRYERGRCEGPKPEYSVAAGERVNVCLRLVHAREKEDVFVFWEKDGGTMRRSQIPVNPTHAYRTRAYLVLRREYVGRWTVRVQSVDGAELARDTFEVVD